MPKLNQVIAVANTKKAQAEREKTEIYKRVQRRELFDGMTRTYTPIDEEGEQLPAETKRAQVSVESAIQEFTQAMTDMIDVVATQDYANCIAKADVVVDGEAILTNVPVTHLLFLEKQLQDVHTFINHLPVLDPAESWTYDDNRAAYVTDIVKTNRTKKVMRNHVLHEATPQHPAQVQVYTEDVVVGVWNTIKTSHAIKATTKKALIDRIRALQDAVKFAREQANSIEVTPQKNAEQLFSYIFA